MAVQRGRRKKDQGTGRRIEAGCSGISREEAIRLQAQIKAAKIEVIPIGALRANPKNAKRHPAKQIELLASNMRQFGFTNPLLVDEDCVILAGHGRREAAIELGLEEVPAIRLIGLSAQAKRALALADNKLSELGEWDDNALRAVLSELLDPGLDLSFDVGITGFETVEIDRLLSGESDPQKPDPADEAPPLATDRPSITRAGDVWACGKHRLVCGDALEAATYTDLLGPERAQMVFTDPPYNVPNAGHVTKRAGVREFAMAHGEMTEPEFTAFLRTTASLIATRVADAAVVFLCMDWRHLPELFTATRPIFGPPRNLVVWVKTNGGQGSFYRSQHEMILVCVAGDGRPINNFGLGERGRYRTNVWRYPGVNSFGSRSTQGRFLSS